MKIRWTGPTQDAPFVGLLLAGHEYDVSPVNAEAWIASGFAEQVREKKARREAAPESAEVKE